MIHIPTEEIMHPNTMGDSLGYTFVWQAHFLRGIYPNSESQVKSYFESGFLDEVVRKKLFPKTWISEFENEQFCMILEHEFISPVLFATEWNFSMCRDAALLVIDIAQIAWKYGFNMIDCHKLNVLFKDNKPLYVDLGSFIPCEEGSTGWRPYNSFMQSYYYILDVWASGGGQIAKRLMSPGVLMSSKEYYLYKYPIYRCFPFILRLRLKVSSISSIATISTNRFANKKVLLAVKKTINFIKPFECQRLNAIKRKIRRLRKVIEIGNKQNMLDLEREDYLIHQIEVLEPRKSITFIDNSYVGIYSRINNESNKRKIISIQQEEDLSEKEYNIFKEVDASLCSTYFQIDKGGFLIRGRFPERRLSSEIVVLTNFQPNILPYDTLPKTHKALILLNNYSLFSFNGLVIVFFQQPPSDMFLESVRKEYTVIKEWKENGGGLFLRIKK